jgi:hypothetical protein
MLPGVIVAIALCVALAMLVTPLFRGIGEDDHQP